MVKKLNKLKEIREAQNLSKLKLSKLSGVSRVTIGKIESEPDAVVNTSTLKKLADALGVSVSTFFMQ